MSYSCVSSSQIESAIDEHGISKGSSQIVEETENARESVESGVYIIWVPLPDCTLTSSASDEIRSGVGQCCRVGSSSSCLCGHLLSRHTPVKVSQRGYTKPPKCLQCKKCPGFSYVPVRPEECGQWWLPRRSNFNAVVWQNRVKANPHEYACIGCEQRVDRHETVFESRQTRISRGASVDGAYFPLAEHKVLSDQVLGGRARIRNSEVPVKAGVTLITVPADPHSLMHK